MIEFFDRLVGPIDTDGVRIYRQRTSITQLVVMMVLAVICYQFTAIGDSGICGGYETLHHESHNIYEN